LTEEEKAIRFKEFVKEKEPLLKQYGMLKKYEDTKKFLLDHPELVCEDTGNFLVYWCIDLALEEKFDLMDHISHQCIAMQFLIELAKQLDRDPRVIRILLGDDDELYEHMMSCVSCFG
jgi:cell division cycle protein 37